MGPTLLTGGVIRRVCFKNQTLLPAKGVSDPIFFWLLKLFSKTHAVNLCGAVFSINFSRFANPLILGRGRLLAKIWFFYCIQH